MSSNVTKIAAGAAAVIAIGVGAAAVGSASSNNNGGGNAGAAFQGPPGAQNQQAGNVPPGTNGSAPQGGAAGIGAEATGADAEKAKNAALDKYPGTVEKVLKRPDGGYVVHVIKEDGSGEVHVLVDEDFDVTGTGAGRGGPPGGMMPPGGQVPPGANGQQPPAGGQPPSGAQPPASAGSGSTT